MRTHIFRFLFPVVTACIVSCSEEPGFKTGDTVFFPDTVAFIRDWDMKEHVMREDLLARDSFYNQLGLDTFELSYSMCDCPDWIDKSKEGLGCKECSDFYIEAADPSLELPGRFHVSGNTVRFYGVVIPGYNLPQGREFTVPDPPEWTVIRYYGYEVVRPYTIWGPNMKEFQEPSDTLEHSVELIFR